MLLILIRIIMVIYMLLKQERKKYRSNITDKLYTSLTKGLGPSTFKQVY